MENEIFEMIAQRLKALADPTRLKIMKTLLPDETCVTDIVNAVGCSQANISKHLRVLQQAGFVARRKDKGRVFYRVSDSTVTSVCDILCGSIADQLRDRQKHVRNFRSLAKKSKK